MSHVLVELFLPPMLPGSFDNCWKIGFNLCCDTISGPINSSTHQKRNMEGPDRRSYGISHWLFVPRTQVTDCRMLKAVCCLFFGDKDKQGWYFSLALRFMKQVSLVFKCVLLMSVITWSLNTRKLFIKKSKALIVLPCWNVVKI